MESKLEFGKLVRDARRARRWTLAKLAEATGFSRGTFSKLENGVYDRPPSDRLIDAVSAALGIDRALLAEARNAYTPPAIGNRESVSSATAERDRAVEAFYVAGSSSALSLLSDPPLDRALEEAVRELVRAARRGLDAHQPSAANTLLELARGMAHSKMGDGLEVTNLEIAILTSLARSRLRARQGRLERRGNRADAELFEDVTEIGQFIANTPENGHETRYVWFLTLKELASFAARLVRKTTSRPSLELILSWPQVNEDLLAKATSQRFVVKPTSKTAHANAAQQDVSLDESLMERRIIAESEVALSLFHAAIELEPIAVDTSDTVRSILKQAHWRIERAIVMRDMVRLQTLLVTEGYSIHPDTKVSSSWCEDAMRQEILEVRQRARRLTSEEHIGEARSFLAYAHLELGFLLRTRGSEVQDLLAAFWNFTLASALDRLFEEYAHVQLKEIWSALNGNNTEYVRLERQVERKLSASNIAAFDYDF